MKLILLAICSLLFSISSIAAADENGGKLINGIAALFEGSYYLGITAKKQNDWAEKYGFKTGFLLDQAEENKCLPQLASRLKLDSRPIVNGTLNPILVALYQSIGELVQDKQNKTTAIYGASGADLSSLLLTTNATNLILVDISSFDIKKFKQYISNPKRLDTTLRHIKYFNGGDIVSKKENGKIIDNIEERLALEMDGLGVDLSQVKVLQIDDHSLNIFFKWAYLNQNKKQYRIVFFPNTNITQPKKYSPRLKKIIEDGFDFYFQKAALAIPQKYADFLPYLAEGLNHGGYLLTGDFSQLGHLVWELSPADKFVENISSGTFSDKISNIKIDGIKRLLQHVNYKVRGARLNTFKKRVKAKNRSGEFSDESQFIQARPYWWTLAIRQKMAKID